MGRGVGYLLDLEEWWAVAASLASEGEGARWAGLLGKEMERVGLPAVGLA
jgi:hypothetical protein